MHDLQTFLKENTLRGTPLFPVGFYTVRYPENSRDMLVHWHEEAEFTLVREGKLRYEINQVPYALSQGDILLLSPNTLHAAHQIAPYSAVSDTAVFSLDMVGLQNQEDGCSRNYLQPVYDGTLEISPVFHPGDPGYDSLLQCFGAMWDCRHADCLYRELTFKTQILLLIRSLWEASGGRRASLPQLDLRLYARKLRPALSYIELHYGEPMTIQTLSRLCGFSQVHFMNLFKAALGMSCMEYLIAYRLNAAAIRLQNTEQMISQIALDCGFASMSYFNRCFRRRFSMTPSAYRNRSL